ncbi:probable calcium-binding protein CML18 [Nymphaea colorata]|nr:probable calcium-binding protein CML18 [Nymphaea colorata]
MKSTRGGGEAEGEKMSTVESSAQGQKQSPPPRDAREEMERVFRRFDTDGDGKISVSELGELLRAFGSAVSEDEAARMMRDVDVNGDGFIDMDEFAQINGAGGETGAAGGGCEEQGLREAFAIYDLDKDGRISAKELHRVLGRMGEKCSVKECCRMISSIDADGDGHVNFDEFKRMMSPSSAPSPSPRSPTSAARATTGGQRK